MGWDGRSETPKRVLYSTPPVSLPGCWRSLQRRQGFFERTISTPMNDLLGPHLGTASLNPIRRLLKRPSRSEWGLPDFPSWKKVRSCPSEQRKP